MMKKIIMSKYIKDEEDIYIFCEKCNKRMNSTVPKNKLKCPNCNKTKKIIKELPEQMYFKI